MPWILPGSSRSPRRSLSASSQVVADEGDLAGIVLIVGHDRLDVPTGALGELVRRPCQIEGHDSGATLRDLGAMVDPSRVPGAPEVAAGNDRRHGEPTD